MVFHWTPPAEALYLFDSEGHSQWVSTSAELLATLAALHVFEHLEFMTDNRSNEGMRIQLQCYWLSFTRFTKLGSQVNARETDAVYDTVGGRPRFRTTSSYKSRTSNSAVSAASWSTKIMCLPKSKAVRIQKAYT